MTFTSTTPPFEAIWNSNGIHIPLHIIKYLGEKDEKKYYQSEGSATGIPEDQLEEYILYIYKGDDEKEFVMNQPFTWISKDLQDFYFQKFGNNIVLRKKYTLRERLEEIVK